MVNYMFSEVQDSSLIHKSYQLSYYNKLMMWKMQAALKLKHQISSKV